VDAGMEGLPKAGWSTPSSLRASPARFPSAVGLSVLSSGFDAARVTMVLLSRFSLLFAIVAVVRRHSTPRGPRSDAVVMQLWSWVGCLPW